MLLATRFLTCFLYSCACGPSPRAQEHGVGRMASTARHRRESMCERARARADAYATPVLSIRRGLEWCGGVTAGFGRDRWGRFGTGGGRQGGTVRSASSREKCNAAASRFRWVTCAQYQGAVQSHAHCYGEHQPAGSRPRHATGCGDRSGVRGEAWHGWERRGSLVGEAGLMSGRGGAH